MGLRSASVTRMTSRVMDSIAEVFTGQLAVLGAEVRFGTLAVTAIIGEPAVERELVEGGLADSGNLTGRCLAADVATAPAIGSAATFQGRSYRVTRYTVRTGHPVAEFGLRPAGR